MTEHWLSEQENSSVNLNGYNKASVYCRKEKSKGGSVIFIKSGIDYETISVDEWTNDLDFEISVVKVGNIFVFCIYRSPQGNVNNFLANLEELLKKHSLNKKKIIICGDFNIDFLGKNIKKISEKKKLCDLFDEFGFKNSITSATRKTLTSESMIDYIATNLEENNIISVKDSVDLALSDHSMQVIEVLVQNIQKKTSLCRD